MAENSTHPSTFEHLELSPVPDESVQLNAASFVTGDAPFLADIQVTLEVRLGSATVSVKDLLALKPGSTVQMHEHVGELVELRLNQAVIARGELVAIGDNFGVRIVEVQSRS